MTLHNAKNATGAAAAAIAATIAVGSQASAGISPPTSGFARFSRESDTIQVLGNTIFNRGDFTYEFHIRLQPGSAAGHVISEQRDTYEDKTDKLSGAGDYQLSAAWSDPAVGAIVGQDPGIPSGDWFHFAYVRSSGTATIFVNGVATVSQVANFAYGDSSDSWMSIGMFRYGAGYAPTPAYPSFIGDLDWIRVSAGALYTSNFAPPSEGDINADPATQLLFKFNEAAGTTTIYDESTNHFQGNLGVPVSPGVTATAPTLMTGTVPAPGALPLAMVAAAARRRRRR